MSPFKKMILFALMKTLLKWWNVLFILSKKLFSFLWHSNTFSDFFGSAEKRLDQKDEVNFKIYDLINYETNTSVYVLPSISKSKDNQTIKFGQLVEYDLRNIFLKKSCKKWGKKISSSRLFFFLKKKGFIWASRSHNNFIIFLYLATQ